MIPELADVAKVAAKEAELSGALGRLTMLIAATDSPVVRLVRFSDELATVVWYAERQTWLAAMADSPAARQLAVEGIETVLAVAPRHAQGAELEEAVRILLDRRAALLGSEALARRAGELVGTAAERALARAERLAERFATRNLASIASDVESIVLGALTGNESSPARAALELFVRTVTPTDYLAWRAVAEKVAGFRVLPGKLRRVQAAGGIAAFGEEEFRRLVAPEVGQLKGLLGELWTWRSRVWRIRERALYRTGLLRGRAMSRAGAELRPLVIREPLLDRAGRQIYDGSIMLARPLSSGNPSVQVFEAHAHALLQVQTRSEVSLVDVLNQDFERELRVPGGLELHTADYKQTFLVRAAPDGQSPTRVLVAPELDAMRRNRPPPGVQSIFIPSLPDATQFTDIAYLMISGLF